ncbi:hypothetical protein L1987_18638 [Smallanthus sonchifolius]|uniref:Uncharacterized protein n=1 Tax=Smallanthus sonchifolius TaxID=185202 RepID=A0ACB9J2I7_9ASTR|nr:hypothetical protein L1987_18638 [Smallanthus sonchifolius]
MITTPCHKEILAINSWTTQRPYTLMGYAYSGMHTSLFIWSNKNNSFCVRNFSKSPPSKNGVTLQNTGQAEEGWS